MKTLLRSKLEDKSAVIAIIGLGYVGLPLALAFSEQGFKTIGYDTSVEKIGRLQNGVSDIHDISSERLNRNLLAGNFLVTQHANALLEADAVLICVPTPLNKAMEPDLSFITQAVDVILEHAKSGILVALESTTYPGTTRDVICEAFSNKGFTLGRNFFAVYSPERVDPGNTRFTTYNTAKVVGGAESHSRELGELLYKQVVETVVPVNSLEVAEMSKLLENTFRSINIGFINEMALLAEKLDIDIWETIEAASSKPFGFMKFTPGPGIGGHCIPLDPMYLAWRAKSENFYSRFIQLAHEVNYSMPDVMVQYIADTLNELEKPIRHSKILLLGVTYKENSSDLREAPALKIFEMLRKKGAHVSFCDPVAKEFIDDNGETQTSLPLQYERFQSFDLAIFLTNHQQFSLQAIGENCHFILDTKNVLPEDFYYKTRTFGKSSFSRKESIGIWS